MNPEDLARRRWRPVAKAVEKRNRLGAELAKTNERLVLLRNELPQAEQADRESFAVALAASKAEPDRMAEHVAANIAAEERRSEALQTAVQQAARAAESLRAESPRLVSRHARRDREGASDLRGSDRRGRPCPRRARGRGRLGRLDSRRRRRLADRRHSGPEQRGGTLFQSGPEGAERGRRAGCRPPARAQAANVLAAGQRACGGSRRPGTVARGGRQTSRRPPSGGPTEVALVRLCRHCGRLTTEGYFHVECGKAHEREKSRRRRARKGTTSQRGYDVTHQRLSKLAIAQHPWCVDCGTSGDLCGDHIIPTSRGGRNTLDNYEVRCRGCNNSRMANEKRPLSV